eukprot:IDg5175t1
MSTWISDFKDVFKADLDFRWARKPCPKGKTDRISQYGSPTGSLRNRNVSTLQANILVPTNQAKPPTEEISSNSLCISSKQEINTPNDTVIDRTINLEELPLSSLESSRRSSFSAIADSSPGLLEHINRNYTRNNLSDAINELQELTEDAEKRLKLLDGVVIRRESWKPFLFAHINLLCTWMSFAGAYHNHENCDTGELVMSFFEFYSVTLIALISISTFLGVKEFANLCSVSLDRYPLTAEEKFLISLIAANSEKSFDGVSRRNGIRLR